MDKPFQISDLTKRLVARAKTVAVGAADDVLSWTAESCIISDNAIVKGIGSIVIGIKPVVLQEVEKAVKGSAQPSLVAKASISKGKSRRSVA